MTRYRSRSAIGVFAAGTVSALAWRSQALTRDGAVAATAVGGVTVAAAGFRGGAALVAFLVSSTLLGRLPHAEKLEQLRGNKRDAVQVLANGGIAAVLALASALAPDRVRALLQIGFGGAVATAAADTWATEIGTRSRQRPRSVTTWRSVPTGASGGVTGTGLVASAAGGTMIARIVSPRTGPRRGHSRASGLAIAIGGFSGALVDSLLGATVQEVRFCDTCLQETELRVDRRGHATRSIRGVSWCTNDAVNAMSTAAGAIVAMAVAAIIQNPPWRAEIPSPRARGEGLG